MADGSLEAINKLLSWLGIFIEEGFGVLDKLRKGQTVAVYVSGGESRSWGWAGVASGEVVVFLVMRGHGRQGMVVGDWGR